MKVIRFSIYLLLLSIVLLSCNSDKDKDKDKDKGNKITKERIAELKAKNKELKKEAEKKEESIQDFMSAFNSINKNLQIIKQKENIISMSAAEAPDGIVSSEKIKDDILLIYKLLEENKKTVNKLRNKLEKTNMINKEMRKSLDILSESIEQKNNEISDLRNKLTKKNTEMQSLHGKLDSLIKSNEKKKKTINKQREILNTGYYVIGTSKELYNRGITNKTGGIIGIGDVNELEGYFDKSHFKKIEIHKKRRIHLNCDKARLLSAHPLVSYKYTGPEGKIEDLIITRPEKFWSTSKYLVIEVEY